MDIDLVLNTMRRHGVRFLLIGGMNFLLRHKPVLTHDIDLWIEDTAPNRRACEQALAALQAEWGMGDDDWGPVTQKPPGWLDRQGVYCLHSPAGAIDIFRGVKGLGDWQASYASSYNGATATGAVFHGLSDEDMLACQLALDPALRKQDRIAQLRGQRDEKDKEASDG